MKIIRQLSAKLNKRNKQLVKALKNSKENLDKSVRAFKSAIRTKRQSRKLTTRIKDLMAVNLDLKKINGQLLSQIEQRNQTLTLRSNLMNL